MKTKIEIKTFGGKLLFEFETENNSVKKTLIESVSKGADLRYADLRGADLRGAYLRYADLRGAYLQGADLRYADLRGAYLQGADLRYADLRGADLRYAYLRGAYLRGADLQGANNIPFIPLACPSDGAFIGWKILKNHLIKLLIPEDAKRCSATTNKCRCDKAKVLSIVEIDSGKSINEITNDNYTTLIYKVGEMVFPDKFDEDRFNECSNGIHFFINKEEALRYE